MRTGLRIKILLTLLSFNFLTPQLLHVYMREVLAAYAMTHATTVEVAPRVLAALSPAVLVLQEDVATAAAVTLPPPAYPCTS